MDVTALGALLVGVGAVAAAAMTYIGKRGENTSSRMNAEMDQVQEERDGLRVLLADRDTRLAELVADRDARLAELLQARLDDQVLIARLRVRIIEQGGEP